VGKHPSQPKVVADTRSIIVTIDLADPEAPLVVDLGSLSPIVAGPVLYDAWVSLSVVSTTTRVSHASGVLYEGPIVGCFDDADWDDADDDADDDAEGPA
jgi:hypothetical protein